jgi:Putative MetA-pathway of phenol degradation
VDYGVEPTEPVHLVGDGLRLRDARQVADDDVVGAGDLLAGLFGARGAAGVQHDLVPLLNQKLGGHFSETVRLRRRPAPTSTELLWLRCRRSVWCEPTSISDTVTGFGDLYPLASLKWNAGVNNFMTYVTGDIPVGNYSSMSLANLGLGHAAIDAGGGYTYFNPATGREFSAVAGSPIT